MPLSFAEARQKVAAELRPDAVIQDSATITKPYGWVFFHQSRRYLETRELVDMLFGNDPIVVMAATGEVFRLGTAKTALVEIERFERAHKLSGA